MVTFPIVISSGTLWIISLRFLTLSFIISSYSPHLVLIVRLKEFSTSSLHISINILPSRRVLKFFIPTLLSVGFISFFNWSVPLLWLLFLTFNIILYRLPSSSFSTLETSFLLNSDVSTCCASSLWLCCRWFRVGATCLAGSMSLVLYISSFTFINFSHSSSFSLLLSSRCVFNLAISFLRVHTDCRMSCFKSF